MQTIQEKEFHHIVMYIGQKINTELQTVMMMVIPEQTHIQEILYQHTRKVQQQNTNNTRLKQHRQ